MICVTAPPTLALAAGVDMKVVYSVLLHSSITVTTDTYTTVRPEESRSPRPKHRPRSSPALVAHSRDLLGIAGDNRGQPESGRNASRKHKFPRSPLKVTWGARVRHQGLEPRTRWLR